MGIAVAGSGVRAGAIQRIRDDLIENRLRLATQSSGEWDFMANAMAQLEATLGEPSDTGLQTDLDRFWAAWQKVATSPDSLPIRNALLGDAAALCARIRYSYTQISNVSDDLNLATTTRVGRINSIATEMARLNSEIASMSSGEYSANSLLDRRDALVLELSRIVSISQHGQGGPDFIVSIGGRVLVQGTHANALTSEPGPSGAEVVGWASDGEAVVIQGGELKAIADLNHTTVPAYLQQMDDFASSLVTAVNALHATGKTVSGADGGDFFTAGTTAANISLDASIADNPSLVAASASGAIGNGDIALQIASLKTTVVAGNQTINQMYQSLVSDLGEAGAMAEKQAFARRLSLQQFTSQQQSISGVSLDEEMTNMVKFQQAYNAAARTLSVMDEMLTVLIERTGIVGR
ncbi:MAG: flagellar hook-associated protein FlgK [Burkholderiales bacterium]|nr:flagellar hook-associated protein FlgK [Burkholderiales bacterium]